MDALADILRSIRLSASTDFCTEFFGPWGMDVSDSRHGAFHAVIEGTSWLYVASQDKTFELRPGDVVAFPTGGVHWLSDHPNSPRMDGEALVTSVIAGENPFAGNSPTAGKIRLLCGTFDYDTKFKHPFLSDLPCFIHIRASDVENPHWHELLIENISHETRAELPGSDLVVNRLCEILFVYLLRQHIKHSEKDLSYLRALDDPQVGKSLNLIHSESSATWTVESLAQQVGLSRTAFSEKFTQLVHVSPKQYLTRWRMQRARSLLRESNRAMIDIAEASGYASEASFSKAFKAFFGESPGNVRRA